MGVVVDHLKAFLGRQVEEHGLVVWFDPDEFYRDLVERLDLPDTTVATYRGSFYELRHEVEPLLSGPTAPRLVVYVPLAEEVTDGALAELTGLAVVLKPGQQPWQRNTRPSLLALGALRPLMPPEKLSEVQTQLEQGKLTLADLDALAGQRQAPVGGVVSVIFQSVKPEEVALAFLSSEEHDQALLAKGALPELASLLCAFLGAADLPTDRGPGACRAKLARHVLLTEFLAGLRGPVPGQLASVPRAASEETEAACVKLARAWRASRDLALSYEAEAARVEREMGLRALTLPAEAVYEVETFAFVDTLLQRDLARDVLARRPMAQPDLADRRRRGFWAERRPELAARWKAMALVIGVLREADRVEGDLKSGSAAGNGNGSGCPTPASLVAAYAQGVTPWCALDTLHRRLEELYWNLSFHEAEPEDADLLEQLVARARLRYREVAGLLARRFVEGLIAGGSSLAELPRQTEVYSRWVAPALSRGKTAYLLVDALRYEMALDLGRTLGDGFAVDVHPVIAAAPTITRIGMAALMPAAPGAAAMAETAEGKLAVALDGCLLSSRAARIEYLKRCLLPGPDGKPARVEDFKLDELLQPGQAVRKRLEAADLAVVTSQEIDRLCESDDVALARKVMEGLLENISRALHTLGRLGFQTIVMAADHGFVFADEAGPDQTIDPPGGHTVELHRRAWVGMGGTKDPAFARLPLRDVGLGETELELAVPWGLGVFKAPGGRAYFHGGLAPQEVIVPAAVIRPVKAAAPADDGRLAWNLVPGTKKLTSRFFTVQVIAEGLFTPERTVVRVELRAVPAQGGQPQTVSLPVAASYGFDEGTRNVELRKSAEEPGKMETNTVTLAITQELAPGQASVHLIDAGSGVELARLAGIEVVPAAV
jgi:hypothetical protein